MTNTQADTLAAQASHGAATAAGAALVRACPHSLTVLRFLCLFPSYGLVVDSLCRNMKVTLCAVNADSLCHNGKVSVCAFIKLDPA